MASSQEINDQLSPDKLSLGQLSRGTAVCVDLEPKAVHINIIMWLGYIHVHNFSTQKLSKPCTKVLPVFPS